MVCLLRRQWCILNKTKEEVGMTTETEKLVAEIVVIGGGGAGLAAAVAAAEKGCKSIIVLEKAGAPAGSTSIIEGANDASEGWIGDILKTVAGFAGCGGLVAVGRKMLKDRANRRKLVEQETALREIVAGVEAVKQEATTTGSRRGITEKLQLFRQVVMFHKRNYIDLIGMFRIRDTNSIIMLGSR